MDKDKFRTLIRDTIATINLPSNVHVSYEEYSNLKEIDFQFTHEGEKFKVDECSNIITFDTEANNGFRMSDGKVIGINLKKLISDKVYAEEIDNSEKQSLTYLWQVAVENHDDIYVFLGSGPDEFIKFMDALALEIKRTNMYGGLGINAIKEEYDIAESTNRAVKFYVFVHNLGYDFTSYILNNYESYFRKKKKGKSKNVFAKNPCSPMKASFRVKGVSVEMRDTFSLVRKSLRAWSKDENLAIKKLEESLLPDDFYLMVRIPYVTPLTALELEYSINDVVCMVYGLKKYRNDFFTLKNIPLTETGILRRILREAVCMKNKIWAQHCVDVQQAYTFEEYRRFLALFMGGWTHVNALYSGQCYKKEMDGGEFYSFDISSSYPFAMCTMKYPVNKMEWVDPKDFDKYEDDELVHAKYRWYAKFKFTNLCSKVNNTFFALSKTIECKLPSNVYERSACVDNGKLFSAEEMTCYMTDVDWVTFKKCYSFDTVEVQELYVSEADYLPKEFILKLLEFYNGKSMLKGVKGQEENYKALKRYNNGSYGIAAQKLCNDDINLEVVDDELQWTIKHIDGNGDINIAMEIFYTDIQHLNPDKVFLMYQIAPWVTAWARSFRLFRAVLHYDDETWYSDTDSLKGKFSEIDWFEEENRWVKEREDEVAADLGIDPELFNPQRPLDPDDPDGPKDPTDLRLGIWDREKDIEEFVAFRAKCYCYRTVDHKMHVTVAGLPEEAGVAHKVKKIINGVETEVEHGKIHNIDDFQLNTIWNASESFKSISYYNYKQTPGVWVDRDGNTCDIKKELGYYPKYGICLMPTTFDVKTTEEYDEFLDVFTNGKDFAVLNELIDVRNYALL